MDLLGSLHTAGPQAMQQAQEEATLPEPLSMHLPRIATPFPLTQLPDPKRASLVQPRGATDPVPHTFHDQPQPEPAQRPPGIMAQAASLLAHTHPHSLQAQARRGPYEAGMRHTGVAAASQAQPRASPQPSEAVLNVQGADSFAQSAGSSASVGVPTPVQTAHSHAEAQQPSLGRHVAGQQSVGQPLPSHQDQQHDELADDDLAAEAIPNPQFAHTDTEPGSSAEDEGAAEMSSASASSFATTSSVASPAPVPAIMAANPMYAAYSSTAPSSVEALQLLQGSSPSNGPVGSSNAAAIRSLIPPMEAASGDGEFLHLLSQAQPDDPAPLDIALLSLTQSLSALERLASGSPFTA